jgi:hypothetical protein
VLARHIAMGEAALALVVVLVLALDPRGRWPH